MEVAHGVSTPSPPQSPGHYISEADFFGLPTDPADSLELPPATGNETVPTPAPRKSSRVRFPTWKVRDSLPEPVTFPQEPRPTPIRRVLLLVREQVSSVRNKFGLSRLYRGRPSANPDSTVNLGSPHPPSVTASHPPTPDIIPKIIHPYPNLSSFLFDHNFWTSPGKKSRADRDRTAKLLNHPSFHQEDILGVNFRAIEQKLKGYTRKAPWEQEKGWRSKPITISIPRGVKQTKAVKATDTRTQARVARHGDTISRDENTVPGSNVVAGDLHYRPICEVIREVFSTDPSSKRFHYHPYEETWIPNGDPDATPERVYGELYSSQAWIEEDRKIQFAPLLPDDPDKDLPRAIAALHLASDGTKLGHFGTAKAWPVYAFFGNQSKYERGQPSAHAAHHLAYLPSVHPIVPLPSFQF